jgi:tetratricopeptide (TPR) repeat protein
VELAIKNHIVRRLLVVLELVIFLAAAGWVAKTCVASALAKNPTVENLELAAKLDPNNSEYHLKLGRLYEYSIADFHPQKALEHLRRAAELNPYDPDPWLEMGLAMQLQGKFTEAEMLLRRADSLAPNIPAYQWRLANFFLLPGNIDEAFRHFRVVLAGTREYDQIVFRTAWKGTDNAEKILNELIPPSIPTEIDYLYYLLFQERFTEAQAVWKRIASSSEKFNPKQIAGYIDALIRNRRPEEAYQIWLDLGRKGLLRIPIQGTGGNLVRNGDFEGELINMGFDWHITPIEGVYAGLDTTTYHSPSHALRVQFSGKQNVDYMWVGQYVKVAPGRSYHLQAFLKTEGITTDSGLRLEVVDVYNPLALDLATENMTGSSDGWTSVGLDFKTGPKTELLLVRLRRWPSQRIDNLISGSVWLDDVQLTPVAK